MFEGRSTRISCTWQNRTFSKTAPCKFLIRPANFARPAACFALWNSPCISYLLAPFRMGIEEGMGVKIQREVPLVIPQRMQRPWMAHGDCQGRREFKLFRTTWDLSLYETYRIRTWQIWVCLRMAHPNPWLDFMFFFHVPLKIANSAFSNTATGSSQGYITQCTHDPLTPKKG